ESNMGWLLTRRESARHYGFFRSDHCPCSPPLPAAHRRSVLREAKVAVPQKPEQVGVHRQHQGRVLVDTLLHGLDGAKQPVEPRTRGEALSVDLRSPRLALPADLLRGLVGLAQDAAPGLLGRGPDLEPFLLAFGAVLHADPDTLRLHPGEHARPVLLGEIEPPQSHVDDVDAVVAQSELAVLTGPGGPHRLGAELTRDG